MKTPDEIKKGMEAHVDNCCSACTYCDDCHDYNMMQELASDALAYIQQLEVERDQAVSLIPRVCALCKWYGTKHGGFFPDCKNPSGCRDISGVNTGWEWRGVQKEG